MRFRNAFLLLWFAWLLTASPDVSWSAAAPPPVMSPLPGALAVAGDQASPDDVNRLVGTLEDPVARARLIADLKALRAAEKQAAPKSPLGEELGQQVLQRLSDAMTEASSLLDKALQGLGDPHQLRAWLAQNVEDPVQRAAWIEALLQLAVVFGTGAAAGLVTRWLVARPRERFGHQAPTHWWRRLAPLFARTLLDLLPIVVFAVVAYAAMVAAKPGTPLRLVVLGIVSAAFVAELLMAAARFLLSPLAPALRLFRLNDETAAYLDVWLRRLVAVAVYGFFALQVGRALGLSAAAFRDLGSLYGLLLTVLMSVFVLQNRASIARGIRGRQIEDGEVPDPFRRLRRQIGETWHIFAVLYLVAIYLVWVLQVRGGFAYVLRGTALTTLIVLLATVGIRLGRRLWDRMLAVNRELLARYPLIDHRANLYLPYVKRGLILAVQIGAAFAVLAAWQIDVGQAMQGVGRDLLGRIVSLAVVLGVALVLWEAANLAITLYLDRRDRNGMLLLRSARARTLLPLVRNASLVVIVLFAGLTALSQLGIDITPFLAGAGVAGLAIGFGAQTLVKDVITGAFMLFEGTVSIGDVASINGMTGQVEYLTIRTIRLRDGTGVVHTIPFGAINTVSNLTRDFSYWQIDVGVAQHENADRAIDVLRRAFETLRQDAKVAHAIIGGLEVDGIDRFEAAVAYIRVRIKTWPGQQGLVGRAYNRLIKLAFDEHGIEMAVPQQIIRIGPEPDGTAPILRVRNETAAPAAAPARKSRSG